MSVAYTIGGNAFRVVSTASSVSSWVTSTSTGYGITGATRHIQGVYWSPAASAHCYEQIFEYEPDPRPHTVDWFNEVTTREVTQDQMEPFSDVYGNLYPGMTFSATAYCKTTGGYMSTPILRGVSGYNDNFSATIPVNGYSAMEWEPSGPIYEWPHSASASASGSITEILGNHPGTYHFTVAAHRDLFGSTYEQWAAGECTSAPEGCYLSGHYSFMWYTPKYGNYTASAYETAVVTESSMSPEIMAREEGV